MLPPYDSLKQLTGDFNAFFIGKTQGLRMELMDPSSDHHNEKRRILHCERRVTDFIVLFMFTSVGECKVNEPTTVR